MGLRSILRFEGGMDPRVYAWAAPLVLAAQHAAVAGAYAVAGKPLPVGVTFWLLPLRSLADLAYLSEVALASAFVFGLLVAAVLAWLSFRRAATAGQGYASAALTVVPALQIVAVLALIFMPRRTVRADASPEPGFDAAGVVQGVLAGVGLIVFGVFLSAVVFRSYGSGMFLLTPFLVGVTTAYLVNRKAAVTVDRTLKLVMWALVLSGVALLLLALEGLICIVMAAPLAAVMAVVGAIIGREMALSGRRRARPTAMSVAVLPLVFALEAALPPAVTLDTYETIVIDAPPAEVWTALTRMGEIGGRPHALLRAGLAYPVRGEIRGEGVGAERIGVFSTGEARERVTVWSPGRRLEFIVLSNPPLMDEFSPYEHVHAPHVDGYFETGWTRFDLEPLPGGRTRLVERATHTLRLDPVLYWAPLVRWGMKQNNARVLGHVRRTAEAAASRG